MYKYINIFVNTYVYIYYISRYVNIKIRKRKKQIYIYEGINKFY